MAPCATDQGCPIRQLCIANNIVKVRVNAYETRRVVVADGLGVAVGLQYRVSLHDLIFQRSLSCL